MALLTTQELVNVIKARASTDAAFASLLAADEHGLMSLALPAQTVSVAVLGSSIRGMMYALGKWPGIAAKANAARANADSTPVALACQTLYDLASSDQSVPMDMPAIAAQVTKDLLLMVNANLLSAQDEAMVLGLGSKSVPLTVDQVIAATRAIKAGA